jgi:hypothetical protein
LTLETGVMIDEVLQGRRDIFAGKIAAALNLTRDVFGDVFTPLFCGIESDDPQWIAILPGHQVCDDGFEVGMGAIGFAPDAAVRAEIVFH